MSFLVPMICTLLPQNDCIWLCICSFLVGKYWISLFYNVNSNIVDTNKTRVSCWMIPPPPLQTTEASLKLLFESVLRSFQKHFSISFFFMTDNHFSKSASYVIECNGFYDIVFTSIVCNPFVQFLIVTYSYARSPFCCHLLKIGKSILYFLFQLFCTCPPIFLRPRTPALVNK